MIKEVQLAVGGLYQHLLDCTSILFINAVRQNLKKQPFCSVTVLKISFLIRAVLSHLFQLRQPRNCVITDECTPLPVTVKRSNEIQFRPMCNKKVFTFLEAKGHFVEAFMEKLDAVAVKSVEVFTDDKNRQIIKLVLEDVSYRTYFYLKKWKSVLVLIHRTLRLHHIFQ